jgi:hypothetical protein
MPKSTQHFLLVVVPYVFTECLNTQAGTFWLNNQKRTTTGPVVGRLHDLYTVSVKI